MTKPFVAPKIMGIINITKDSFSDGGKFLDPAAALEQARILTQQGAQILDFGGESTRPGATRVPVETEIDRVVPVITAITRADWYVTAAAQGLAPLISVDTMNHQTALAAVQAGATLVNDVSGGLADPLMLSTVAGTAAGYVLGHWRGQSDVMDGLNHYRDVAGDVAAELSQRVAAAEAAGLFRDRIIVDPGLGFAKDAQQNWRLLADFAALEELGLPILVGASRKRFIASALQPEDPASVPNDRRDCASAALAAVLASRHAIWAVRVHNVTATVDAFNVLAALGGSQVAAGNKGQQS